MPEYGFILTEHDPERPWIVVGQEQRVVWLDDRARFVEWAAEQWPAPRWTAELDPWQDGPEWPRSVRPSTALIVLMIVVSVLLIAVTTSGNSTVRQ